MATRSKPSGEADVLTALLRELQTLNRSVGEIASLLAARASGDMDPGRPIDPGDAVPEGVAPLTPPSPTADEKKVRRALERLSQQRRGGKPA